MAQINSRTGIAVLALSHVAGMIDLVALPLWIGTLMQHHGYSAPQAGVIVTAFLAAVAATSLWLAPRFRRLPRFAKAHLGFALSALSFAALAMLPNLSKSLISMILLHALAGIGVGGALSLTHGSIGRSHSPHRLFALNTVALGVFAIVFFALVPQLIRHFGPSTLFVIFTVVMGVAAIATRLGFPDGDGEARLKEIAPQRLSRVVWLVMAAVVCLTLNQAMVFSFVERIGAERGFGIDRMSAVLVALGLVNLLPGVLATWLQARCSPLVVGTIGPVIQAALALLLSSATTFEFYAAGTVLYTATTIFTHTFLFGLISSLDRSGRAVAGTPAMLMLGSCTGPALGGVVIQMLGYQGLGWVASGVAVLAVLVMLMAGNRLRGGQEPFSAKSSRDAR